MDKILTFAAAIAMCLGTTAFLANNTRAVSVEEAAERQLASDGAFQDGLYLGSLTAREARPFRPPIGRWSRPSDRASFLAGYQRGYGKSDRAVQTAGQNRAEYIRKFGI